LHKFRRKQDIYLWTVSFLAPDNMNNGTSKGDIITGSDAWSDVASLVNDDGVNILLEKAVVVVYHQKLHN